MKVGYIFFLLILASFPAMFLMGNYDLIENLGRDHRAVAGFLFFALLVPLGEFLHLRLSGRNYPQLTLALAAAFLWGLHGLGMSLLYWLINGGVSLAQGIGFLPGGGLVISLNPLAFLASFFFSGPFFTSLFLVLLVIPVFLASQRLILSFLTIRFKRGFWPGLPLASWKADWPDFIRNDLLSLIFLKIPLLTLIFMLPQGLWLLSSAWAWCIMKIISTPRKTVRRRHANK